MSVTVNELFVPAIFTLKCFKCGNVEQISAPVIERGFSNGEYFKVQYPGLPKGWNKVGKDLYCAKHTVQTKRALIIDGDVVEEKTESWSSQP